MLTRLKLATLIAVFGPIIIIHHHIVYNSTPNTTLLIAICQFLFSILPLLAQYFTKWQPTLYITVCINSKLDIYTINPLGLVVVYRFVDIVQ